MKNWHFGVVTRGHQHWHYEWSSGSYRSVRQSVGRVGDSSAHVARTHGLMMMFNPERGGPSIQCHSHTGCSCEDLYLRNIADEQSNLLPQSSDIVDLRSAQSLVNHADGRWAVPI
ncbi:hypothetical protein ILYODFUR_026432 [Ilyodon furcidens]|uniref:Uncharacterized protein n=1 Tax=Ilyodon furcidens TaxID=33524 RepID=A0ABV0V795_9TELE